MVPMTGSLPGAPGSGVGNPSSWGCMGLVFPRILIRSHDETAIALECVLPR